jgi:hypothetical protein
MNDDKEKSKIPKDRTRDVLQEILADVKDEDILWVMKNNAKMGMSFWHSSEKTWSTQDFLSMLDPTQAANDIVYMRTSHLDLSLSNSFVYKYLAAPIWNRAKMMKDMILMCHVLGMLKNKIKV